MPETFAYESYFVAADPQKFVGSAASLWPPANERGQLNIVTGTRKVTHDILSVCLIQKGEDPIHPDFGMAPEIFDSLSDYPIEYWVYHAEQEIQKWVTGISRIDVQVIDFTDAGNRLQTEIRFIPSFTPDSHTLTFGWYDYQGAIWNQDLGTFIKGICLDDQPFHLTTAV